MDKREIRFGEKMELRSVDGASPKIVGYAAVFNSLSKPLGGFRETIAPGAFRSAVVNDDVRALVDHNPAMILGRTKSGTLMLREDEHGLYCEIDPPDTSVGRDLVESLRRGDLDQMSFAFKCISEDWSRNSAGEKVREVREASLLDVSVVAYPAYDATSVSMRSVMFPDGEPEIPAEPPVFEPEVREEVVAEPITEAIPEPEPEGVIEPQVQKMSMFDRINRMSELEKD